MPEAIPTIELFTDGACLGNPGPGGWAYILRQPATGEVSEKKGGEYKTTNNRMEVTAVIKGLESLTSRSAVHLIGDSEYVLKGISEWLPNWKARNWRRGKKGNQPVANIDLWQKVDALIQQHDVTVEWVRGHTGHPENEACDQMAIAAAQDAQDNPPPPGYEDADLF